MKIAQPGKCHWWSHEWSKWEEYKQNVIYWPLSKNSHEGIEFRQKRRCQKCGLTQDKETDIL